MSNTGTGSTLGSIIGGTIGTFIAPGVGTAIGAGIGGKAGDLAENAISGSASPAPIADSDQLELKNYLKSKVNSEMTGTEFNAIMKEINDQAASTNNKLVGASGGSSGGLIASLIRENQSLGNVTNKAYSNAQENSKYYTGLLGETINNIAKRKYDLQNYEYAKALANNAQNSQDAQKNVFAGLSKLDKSSTLPDVTNNTDITE